MEYIKKMKKDKEILQRKSIEELESIKRDLKLQAIIAKSKGNFGFSPNKGTPTKLHRDIKRKIAVVNTLLNQKNQIKDSIERCESKPVSKRRAWRMKKKMKELKVL